MFKRSILKLFTYTGIIYIVDYLIFGFDFSSLFTVLLFALSISILNFTIEPIVKFLTLPFNFVSSTVLNFLFLCALTYFFEIFIGGYELESGFLRGASNSFIQMPDINLAVIGVVIVSSLFIAVLNNVVEWTLSK